MTPKKALATAAITAALVLLPATAHATTPCPTKSTTTTTAKPVTTTEKKKPCTTSTTVRMSTPTTVSTTSSTIAPKPVSASSVSISGTTPTTEADKPEAIGGDVIGQPVGSPDVAQPVQLASSQELAHTGVNVWPFIIGGLVLFILGELCLWAGRKIAAKA